MVKTFIYCNRPSNSAKALSLSTGFRRIRRERSRFRGGLGRLVVNWGCSTAPEAVQRSLMLNRPDDVARMSNKLRFFRWMRETFLIDESGPFPAFTESLEEAQEWMEEDARKIVCRTILNGHSGAGIVVASTPDELVPAPLYTQYIPKDIEWRVHVFRQGDGSSVDVQKKVKRKDYEGEHNRLIRNHQNGYVYQRHNIEIPDEAIQLSCSVIEHSGLDFGAVDLIQTGDKFYVLEVNTAPGLTGTTLEVYTREVKKMTEGYNF